MAEKKKIVNENREITYTVFMCKRRITGKTHARTHAHKINISPKSRLYTNLEWIFNLTRIHLLRSISYRLISLNKYKKTDYANKGE